MPRVERQCNLCGETDPPPKQCSACKKAWYCSVKCQKYDWFSHIFDCNPSRPITTAGYLALAVGRNLVPQHSQTCTDAMMLLGLYTGLLDPDRLGVKPYALHKWRVNGSLIDNIKKEFNRLPEGERGKYFSWFLQNQDVIGRRKDDQEVEARRRSEVEESICQAYCFIGQPPTTSQDEISRWCQSIPKRNQDCFFLYAMILSESRPGSSVPLWIMFAFCACENEEAEMDLSRKYHSLIRKVTFDEFCSAYQSTSLPALFREKGFDITNAYILDVLSFPTMYWKSIWLLKQFIEDKMINGSEDTQPPRVDSVRIDYGFVNCKATEEHKLLFDLYRAFFAMEENANPLELHKACIERRLFAYFVKDLGFKLKPKKVYQRLLRSVPGV